MFFNYILAIRARLYLVCFVGKPHVVETLSFGGVCPPRTFLVNERMWSEVEICVETEMEIWMVFAVDFVGANT